MASEHDVEADGIDTNENCFVSYNDTLNYCLTCNSLRLKNGTIRSKSWKIIPGKDRAGMGFRLRYNAVPWVETIYIHPRTHRYTSTSSAKASLFDGDNFYFSAESSIQPPAPYTECEEVTEEKQKEIDFFVQQYDYDIDNCYKTCDQVWYHMAKEKRCVSGYPCNPLKLKIMLGEQVPQNITNYYEIDDRRYIFKYPKESIKTYLDCNKKCPRSCKTWR